jgi:hypothetical protein
MAWFKRSPFFTILVVALTLSCAFLVSAQVPLQFRSPSLARELENSFRSPNPTLRDTRQGGIRKNPCWIDAHQLIALVPLTEGETSAEYPTVFWYMPRMNAQYARVPELVFTLLDAKEQPIYSARYSLTKSTNRVLETPSIMNLTLRQPHALKIGEEYTWHLRVTCDATEPINPSDQIVKGGIKRVALNPNLARRLQQATPEERIVLYAKAKLWYEMLEELVKLRRDRPNDPNLKDAWEKLFVAVGLEAVSQVPIITDSL